MVEFSSGLKVILTGCCFCTDRNHQITGNDKKNVHCENNFKYVLFLFYTVIPSFVF